MTQGIYIVANDRVADNAISLLSSLRLYSPDMQVVMIPFDDHYHKVANLLAEHYQVEIFPDLTFLEEFTQTIADIFPRDFLKLPNKMRKLAAWFGPLDDFLYIDTDILVFRDLTETLNYLNQADFICCDYHHKGRGLSEVFSPLVIDQGIFTETDIRDVFNSGLWGSRKGALTLPRMTELLKECAAHREYFDFSTGTTDQPIMNYLVLKGIARRLNITKVNPREPGSWAGSSHFRELDHQLYDGDRPLRYLHWAGTPMRPGGPYRELWKYYRFRTVSTPLLNPPPQPESGIRSRLRRWLKRG